MSRDAIEPQADLGFGEGSLYAAHLDRGWHLFDSGDTQGARNSGERAHALVPEDPDAPLLLAAIAQAEGQIEESLRWYETAIDIDPEYPEPYISSAQTLLYELEHYDRAIEKLESAQHLEDLAPLERIEVDLLRAECEFQAQRPADALRSLERLSVVETMSQLVGGSTPLAMAELQKTTKKLKPKAQTQLRALASFAAMDSHELEEQELHALCRRLCFQYYRLGRLLCDLEQSEPARVLIQYALALFPEEADLWYLKGDCEFRLGQTQLALDSSLRVSALDEQKKLPEWAPTASRLHSTVEELLSRLSEQGELPPQIDPDALRVVILERPSFELMFEGMDPRTGLIALSPPPRHPNSPFTSTLVVYRGNLCRFAHSEAQLQSDLWELMQDEMHSHALRLQEMATMELEAALAGAAAARNKRSRKASGPGLATSGNQVKSPSQAAPAVKARAKTTSKTASTKSKAPSTKTKAKTSPNTASPKSKAKKTQSPKSPTSKARTPKTSANKPEPGVAQSSARVPAKKSSRVRKKSK